MDVSEIAVALVERGRASNTAQAAALVMEGAVLVNGLPLTNPRRLVHPTDELTLC